MSWSRRRVHFAARTRTGRAAAVLGLAAAAIAASLIAFVPAGAQEEPPPSDPASAYGLLSEGCLYDAGADATSCTWELTGTTGGVGQVDIQTCWGADALALPADGSAFEGTAWQVQYLDPDDTVDPPFSGWRWSLAAGEVPIGAEFALTRPGNYETTGSADFVLKKADEHRDSIAGPACDPVAPPTPPDTDPTTPPDAPTTPPDTDPTPPDKTPSKDDDNPDTDEGTDDEPEDRSTLVSRLVEITQVTSTADPGDAQTITIRKQTETDDDPTLFSFTLEKCTLSSTTNCNNTPGAWVAVPGGVAAIADDGVFTWGNDNTDNSITYGARYRVLETPPAGYTFDDLDDCDPSVGSLPSGNEITNGASFRLENANGDRSFDCTWDNDEVGSGTLRIHKGGDRASVGGGIDGLNGAMFDVATDADFTNIVGTCTTGPPNLPNQAGQCDVVLSAGDYFVRENTSPLPFNTIPELAIGPGGQANPAVPYRFKVTVEEDKVTNAPPTQGNYQRKFANRRDNLPFPSTCGIDIALMFDRSSSISSSEFDDMQLAGTSFTSALLGTPSTVGVYSFSSSATQNLGLTSVSTQAGVDTVNGVINGLANPSGSTNWDAAFQTVAGDGADVVIMMTDGNPTISNVGGNGSTTTFWEIEEGVASANLTKLLGSKVVALGIGNAVSVTNLIAISGPVQNDDYFVSDFETLKNTLVAIATQLCGAEITVTKLLDGQPSANWVFTPTTQTQGITFNPSPTGSTGGNGQIDFDVNAIPAIGGTITLTETVKPGTTFVSASCTKQGNVPIGTQGANSIQLPVNRQDDIVCVFNNTTNAVQFTVKKDFVPDSGASVSVTLTCTSGTVQAPATKNVSEAAPGVWTVTGYTGSPNCTATENPIPTGYDASGNPAGTCTAALLNPGGCTITNTLRSAKFSVTKDFVPDTGDVKASVTLTCTSGTVTPAGAQEIGDGQAAEWTVTGFDGDPSCTAEEAPIPGYDSTGTCTAKLLDPGECTITNTLRTGKVIVLKRVDGELTDGWTFTAVVDPGSVDPAEGATGDDGTGQVDFDLSGLPAEGSELTITETLQAGHTFVGVECVDGDEDVPVETEGTAATLAVEPDDEITCTFENATEAPPTTTPPTTTPSPTVSPTTGPSPTVSPTTVGPSSDPGAVTPRVVSGSLPFTGSPTAMLVKSALWLLALGGLLLLAVWRRRARVDDRLLG